MELVTFDEGRFQSGAEAIGSCRFATVIGIFDCNHLLILVTGDSGGLLLSVGHELIHQSLDGLFIKYRCTC
jgi:hypothetical protein